MIIISLSCQTLSYNFIIFSFCLAADCEAISPDDRGISFKSSGKNTLFSCKSPSLFRAFNPVAPSYSYTCGTSRNKKPVPYCASKREVVKTIRLPETANCTYRKKYSDFIFVFKRLDISKDDISIVCK